MRKLLMTLTILGLLVMPVYALDLTAPTVPGVRDVENQSFGQAVLEILADGVAGLRPDLREAAAACVTVLAAVAALSVFAAVSGKKNGVKLAGTVLVAAALFRPTHALITLGAATVAELSEYEKLLLPVLTAGLAAQGGVSASAALYAGTAAFNALLSGIVSRMLVPMIYIFLALAVGHGAVGEEMLKKLRDMVKSTAVWGLKTILYVYTGYISVTGVVSGTTDASLLKAAKITISGAVPVVGGILSDASEAVLVGAAAVKNAAGIYGLAAILTMWIGPFLRIGVHYLMVKALGAVSGVFGVDGVSDLLDAFAAAMGLLLAMTGTVCLMLIISTICFLRGVGI